MDSPIIISHHYILLFLLFHRFVFTCNYLAMCVFGLSDGSDFTLCKWKDPEKGDRASLACSRVHSTLPVPRPGIEMSVNSSWINKCLDITIHLTPVLFNSFPFACSAPHKILRFLKKFCTVLGLYNNLITVREHQVLYLKATLSQQLTSIEKAP